MPILPLRCSQGLHGIRVPDTVAAGHMSHIIMGISGFNQIREAGCTL